MVFKITILTIKSYIINLSEIHYAACNLQRHGLSNFLLEFSSQLNDSRWLHWNVSFYPTYLKYHWYIYSIWNWKVSHQSQRSLEPWLVYYTEVFNCFMTEVLIHIEISPLICREKLLKYYEQQKYLAFSFTIVMLLRIKLFI